MKLCNYCHKQPRRADSAHCSKRCEDAKRALNQRNNNDAKRTYNRKFRADRKEQAAIEAQRIYQHAEYMKRKARAVLRAADETPPICLWPAVTVTMWNIRTGGIEVKQV